MQPIYDKLGRVVGWTRNGVVYTLNGQAAAYLSGEHLYTFTGRHLGRLGNGYFRDHSGLAVGFLRGAVGSPLRPMTQVAPLPPLPSLAPLKSARQLAPLPPLPSLAWSATPWEAFLHS